MSRPDPGKTRRPDLVLQALAERHAFDRPRVLLALLSGSYRDQRLAASTVLWSQPPVSERARAGTAKLAAARLGLDDASVGFRGGLVLVPVVVRPDRAGGRGTRPTRRWRCATATRCAPSCRPR